MDKYNSCQPGIWNKNGLRDVNCSKSEPLYVNAPDTKSYQVPLKKIHSQIIGKRKEKYQSLLRIKKLPELNKRELLTNYTNCIYKNSTKQNLAKIPILNYCNNASNLSLKKSKRQPTVFLNMNSSQNVEKLMSIEIKPVFNQIQNHCCNQSELKTNFNLTCIGIKNKAEVYRTGENAILKQQFCQDDGFQQNESRNVVINLKCGHGVSLNIYGCIPEVEGTNQRFATELPNYDELCGPKCYETRKQYPLYDYQQKCYFH